MQCIQYMLDISHTHTQLFLQPFKHKIPHISVPSAAAASAHTFDYDTKFMYAKIITKLTGNLQLCKCHFINTK